MGSLLWNGIQFNVTSCRFVCRIELIIFHTLLFSRPGIIGLFFRRDCPSQRIKLPLWRFFATRTLSITSGLLVIQQIPSDPLSIDNFFRRLALQILSSDHRIRHDYCTSKYLQTRASAITCLSNQHRNSRAINYPIKGRTCMGDITGRHRMLKKQSPTPSPISWIRTRIRLTMVELKLPLSDWGFRTVFSQADSIKRLNFQ